VAIVDDSERENETEGSASEKLRLASKTRLGEAWAREPQTGEDLVLTFSGVRGASGVWKRIGIHRRDGGCESRLRLQKIQGQEKALARGHVTRGQTVGGAPEILVVLSSSGFIDVHSFPFSDLSDHRSLSEW
jgi:hypothetical protein